jgi:polysaccharide chain length determinant protein (PEP-CTERM system associated)
LRSVAERNGLFPPEATAARRDELVAELGESINIVTIRHTVPTDNGERASASSTIEFTYEHSNPEIAVGVVKSLLDSLVSGTLTAGERSADTAEQFLRDEIATVETELRRIEQERAAFLSRHAEQLPGNAGSNYEQIQAQRNELLTVQQELRRAESRRDLLRAQLDGRSPMVASSSETVPPPNSLDARIRAQAAECDRLFLRYTERHLDVQSCRNALASLREQRAEQLRALGVTDPDQELSSLTANPVYQAGQIAFNEAEIEVRSLVADIADREARLAALQALVQEGPEIEAEYTRLNRDYQGLQEKYDDLNRRLRRQQLSRNALATDDVDFRVLNEPRASADPVAPARLQLVVGIFVAGLLVAGAVCYALAQSQPVVGSKRMLRDLTGLPVIGVVTNTTDRGRRILPVAISVVALGVVFLAVVAIEILGPGWRLVGNG